MPNTNSNKKIKITSATGTKDKAQLHNCYFQQDEAPATTYTFYDTNNNPLATGITSGNSFTFSFSASPTVTWTITATIVPQTSATGTWSNNDPTGPRIAGTDPESGEFTAQAGGGDPEEASIATA